MKISRLTSVIASSALVLAAVIAFGNNSSSAAPAEAAASPSVHFTAAGDYGTSAQAEGVLAGTGALHPDFNLAVGDFSYTAAGGEAAWCNLVKSKVGDTFPFELISGNHESNGLSGNIDSFAACLPNRLPGLVGTYGREWYVDYPAVNPVMRVVMISPNLIFPGQSRWTYNAGTSHYQWTADAIDGARTANIPWVVVGMHEPCLSLTSVGCSSGADIMNLLVSKKVDLVLAGHNHLYERTRQLSLSASCPAITPGTSSAACVADSDNDLVQGGGTVFTTEGTGGEVQQHPNLSDPEKGYFAGWAPPSDSWGVLDVVADDSQLTASFKRISGANLSDSFTIHRQGQPPANVAPSAVFSSVVSGSSVAFDGSGSVDPDGSIASYAWTFGDGGTSKLASPSHSYAVAGDYPVTLTVTDNGGATNAVTHTVSVPPVQGGSVAFVAAAHSAPGATAGKSVTVPGTAKVGDTMVLVASTGTTTVATDPSGAGWRKVDTFTNSAMVSTVWTRKVVTGDAGSTVGVGYTGFHKGVLSLSVYSGVDPARISAAHAGDSNTATHTSPTLTATAGDWVLTAFTDTSSATTAWTTPAGLTRRDTAADTGSGRYGLLVADSAGPVTGRHVRCQDRHLERHQHPHHQLDHRPSTGRFAGECGAVGGVLVGGVGVLGRFRRVGVGGSGRVDRVVRLDVR